MFTGSEQGTDGSVVRAESLINFEKIKAFFDFKVLNLKLLPDNAAA